MERINNEILNYPAVYNDNVYTPGDLKSATLAEIFDQIRASDFLKKHTIILRSLQSKEAQKKYKADNLPYFNLGTFTNDYRLNINLISSSFFLYDYDDISNQLEELKSLLKNDNKVFAFFLSPRGNGLKVIYRLDKAITDPEFFSQLYKHYSEELKIDLGADPDNTSDPSRPCYFSYDPDIYCNPDAQTLYTNVITILPGAHKYSKTADLTNAVVDSVLLRRAVEFLRLQKITYNEWLACGFALAPLGEYGRQFFQLLSDNQNFQDTPTEINGKFQNFLDNPQKFNDIDKLFIIAAEYGFEILLIKKEENIVPAASFDKELEEQFLLDETRDPNKLLGFPLTRFKELAGHVDGLQPGFYLLGAESNIGKTAVLTNMCLDVLETNPDVSVIYFSLDDSRKYTAYRFLSIMTQLSINDTHKQQTDLVKAKSLSDGRNNLIELIRSGRLIVKDTAEIYTSDQLISEIQNFEHKGKLVVFIDGLYNLLVGENFKGGIREENIERARVVKYLVDAYRIPLITTGELRKKTKDEKKDKEPVIDDLMETGKFAYNANVVWLLYGKSDDLKTAEPTLTLEYKKNKLSDYKSIQYLTFKRATGTMKELSSFIQVPQLPKGILFSDGGGHE